MDPPDRPRRFTWSRRDQPYRPDSKESVEGDESVLLPFWSGPVPTSLTRPPVLISISALPPSPGGTGRTFT